MGSVEFAVKDMFGSSQITLEIRVKVINSTRLLF